jgi:hypothetical protein
MLDALTLAYAILGVETVLWYWLLFGAIRHHSRLQRYRRQTRALQAHFKQVSRHPWSFFDGRGY